MAIFSLRALLLVAATAAIPVSGWAQQDTSKLPFQKSDSKPAETGQLKAGANSFGEGQARQLLESKGYADISNLAIDHEGIWRGAARKDDRAVGVSVDFQGHVLEK